MSYKLAQAAGRPYDAECGPAAAYRPKPPAMWPFLTGRSSRTTWPASQRATTSRLLRTHQHRVQIYAVHLQPADLLQVVKLDHRRHSAPAGHSTATRVTPRPLGSRHGPSGHATPTRVTPRPLGSRHAHSGHATPTRVTPRPLGRHATAHSDVTPRPVTRWDCLRSCQCHVAAPR